MLSQMPILLKIKNNSLFQRKGLRRETHSGKELFLSFGEDQAEELFLSSGEDLAERLFLSSGEDPVKKLFFSSGKDQAEKLFLRITVSLSFVSKKDERVASLKKGNIDAAPSEAALRRNRTPLRDFPSAYLSL